MNDQSELIYLKMKDVIIDYLTDEIKINNDALHGLESQIESSSSDAQKLREVEAIKLRDRISQLSHHISVIKRMFPSDGRRK